MGQNATVTVSAGQWWHTVGSHWLLLFFLTSCSEDIHVLCAPASNIGSSHSSLSLALSVDFLTSFGSSFICLRLAGHFLSALGPRKGSGGILALRSS